jgi:hypothetical protein
MAKKLKEFESVPEEGAIERDWTDPNTVLVLDVKNAKGEKFHFEVSAESREPRGSESSLPWGPSPINVHGLFDPWRLPFWDEAAATVKGN